MSALKQFSSWSWKVGQPLSSRADLNLLDAFQKKKGVPADFHPLPTRSQLKRLIEEGRVLMNGSPLKATAHLKEDDLIEIEFPLPKPTDLLPESRALEILYEDEHLVVINKPQGLTVHPSPTQMTETLVHALLHHIKDLSGIGGVLRPGIVHRIDKNTSGALVVTKTDEAHLGLSKTFALHQIKRSYWALCYGAPPSLKKNELSRIESLIGRNPKDRKKMSMNVREGRRAVTHYRKLQEFSLPFKRPFASSIELLLETGRTHQIRVHLTGLGYSLLGDPTYGAPTLHQPKWISLPVTIRNLVTELPGQALHARTLGFEHPVTKKALFFEAEPPAQFTQLLHALQQYA